MKTHLLIVVLIACSLSPLFGDEVERGIQRVPTIKEMESLFSIATEFEMRQPVHLIADLRILEQPWTKEQIAAEVKAQNEIMRNLDNGKDLSLARSNSIARQHSGAKTIHVEEWYQKEHYRIDFTDDSSTFRASNSNRPGYNTTYVNLHDASFSPYQAFSVDHRLHSVLLSKDPGRRYSEYRLGKALGMEDSIALPVILAFLDFNAVQADMRGHVGPESNLRADKNRMENIRRGKDASWSCKATDVYLNGISAVKIDLEGKIPDLAAVMKGDKPNMKAMQAIPFHATYWLGENAGRDICLQAMLTNHIERTQLFSACKDFSPDGSPGRWESSIFTNGVLQREWEVTFKELAVPAKFDESKIFLPAAFATNPLYVITDITLGNGVVLQNPLPKTPVGKERFGDLPNRNIVRAVILVLFSAPLIVLTYLAVKKSRKRE